MKYVETLVSFSEVPDEITLCINISQCPNKCKNCHSPYLQENVGKELNIQMLTGLIKKNDGITCVCLMGGDKNPDYITLLAWTIKENGLKVAWYSGNSELPAHFDLRPYSFIKLGPYIEELGPLNKETTNQKFYEVVSNKLVDKTYLFWKKHDS